MIGLLESAAIRGADDDAVDQFAYNMRQSLYTSLPGRIVSFDAAKQTATIKPLYKAKFNGEAVEMPELLEVPVMMPRGGGYGITFPVKEGDGVMLTFQSRNMDKWYAEGGDQEAASARMHDLSDAVAVLGMEPSTRSMSDVQSDRVEFRSDDSQQRVEILDGGLRMVSGKCRFIVRKDKFVQLKVKGSNGRNDSGAAEYHLTINAETGEITASGPVTIGPDPNPED